MEPNLWARFAKFIKSSFQEKFKAFMPGCVMGYIGGQHILFSGVSISMVEYVVKFTGATFMAFGSGLATSYAAYLVEQHKNKKTNGTEKRRKKRDRAA